ncbi:MAG: aminodeoxychorismate lyase [Methylococcales bacterium]|nr:aminodeoxychorismate lyase [Methylococcales bacterium]
MSAPTALINGEPGCHIAVSDRGLAYGDGVFETLAVNAAQPIDFDAHWQRLKRGSQRLRLPCPSADTLRTDLARLSLPERAVLKIILTRGSGGRGYRAPEAPEPTRIVSLHPFPDYPDHWSSQGVKVRVCQTRLGLNPGLAGLKHLNRLDNVLARSEWHDTQIAEGIMLDIEDWVIEGTQSNLFCVANGLLYTPELNRCGVAGITRDKILDIARRLGLTAIECRLTLSQLYQADELFLTNTLIGLWPIRQLEQQTFQAGPVSRRLQQALGISC